MIDPTAVPSAALLRDVPEPLRTAAAAAWEDYRAAAAAARVAPPRSLELLRVLFRVWASSPFVAQSCGEDPRMFAALLRSGDLLTAYAPDRYARLVDHALRGAADEQTLARRLRLLRRREMVRIAWRDLAGWAALEETLDELSALADACIDAALTRLHRWHSAARGAPRGAENGAAQSLVVLGMGKLGARELNFSSDVDLVFAYPEDGETRGRRPRLSNQEFFVGLGQRLIECLGAPTAEGFVFRVDMRLRPFGQSGPLAASFGALEDYYQTQGRDWERYAMIKARPVAGDPAAGAALLEILRPFVYRRYLDYGAFEALRDMKEMINREVERKDLQDDVKRGAGGIREVEFIGQTLQLIRGGREPELQERAILKVLPLLAARGHLPDFACRALAAAYVFLRRVENHLQELADRQTHRLPREETDRLRVAFAMGYGDWPEFARALARHRERVREVFEQVALAPQAAGRGAAAPSGLGALWIGALPAAEAERVLREAGYTDPGEARRRLALLREGYACRSLSARGQTLLEQLMPLLLGAAARGEAPDVALPRLLDLVETVARRSAYLALLVENPMVLSQVVKLCAASPWIAGLLTEQPILLDELLDPRSLYTPLDQPGLEAELRALLDPLPAGDLERHMDTLRHFKQANVLRVAAADLAGAMPLMVVSDHLTAIAEVAVGQVLRLATRDLLERARRRGRSTTDGAGFAVIAYGKLGGIELGYGSDLDLVFLHDGAALGPGPEFHARLGQRIIHMLNAHTPAGVLYEVDVRLRPSGASGLLVSGVEAFSEYQRRDAWTWEHQALVRARPIAGDPAIAARFTALRAEVLGRERDPEQLRAEVREMRERMRAELARGGAGRFDIKQDRGGIADIEFLVQYAVLRWAARAPRLLRWTDNMRLLDTLEQEGLMPGEEIACLRESYRAYRRRVHRLALQERPAVVAEEEFREQRAAVARIWRRLMES